MSHIKIIFTYGTMKGVIMHSLLTKREREIFVLLIASATTKDIADKLCISEKTVRNHISNVIQKLGVESRIQAVLELLKMKEIDF